RLVFDVCVSIEHFYLLQPQIRPAGARRQPSAPQSTSMKASASIGQGSTGPARRDLDPGVTPGTPSCASCNCTTPSLAQLPGSRLTLRVPVKTWCGFQRGG